MKIFADSPLARICIFLYLTYGWSLFSLRGQNFDPYDSVLELARTHVDTLTSDYMGGRGYVANGHQRAARYIAHEFKRLGFRPVGKNGYLQPFGFEINLPTDAKVQIDGTSMVAGKDFIVNRFSGSGAGSFKVLDAGYGLQPPRKVKNRVILFRSGFPPEIANDSEQREKYAELARDDQRIEAMMKAAKPAGFIIVKSKLTAGFTASNLPLPVIEFVEDSLPQAVRRIEWDIKSSRTKIESQNVLGLLPGTQRQDSMWILTAHYDHLGRYAEALFTGANDNASGISMLLSLAEYFSKNPLDRPILFVGFSGEEAGLQGSRYYALQEPIISLRRFQFILNLDLMGNGVDGIMAVGGKDFPAAFQHLQQVNDSLEAVPKVRARKNAPNSDHYFFLKSGVPGFFIYTLGGPPHYHDVQDNAQNLEFSRFVEVRELLIRFMETYHPR